MSPSRRLWSAWLRIGLAINNVLARILLTVFYYTLFVPFGIGVRFLSDPLDIELTDSGGWKHRQHHPSELKDFRRLS